MAAAVAKREPVSIAFFVVGNFVLVFSVQRLGFKKNIVGKTDDGSGYYE